VKVTRTDKQLVAGLVLGLGLIAAADQFLGLTLVTSRSIEPYALRAVAAPVAAGRYVKFCPPSLAGLPAPQIPHMSCPLTPIPFVKPVVAVSGDVVELTDAEVRINGVTLAETVTHYTDKEGRPVNPYPRGTYRVGPDEIWVVSNFAKRSFDSRYFGPIQRTEVKAVLQPIL
jgi:conjugative transfer signal peptidase TraF